MRKWLLLLFLPSTLFARTHPSLLNTQADWTAMIASSTIHPWSNVVSGATMYLSGPQAVGVNSYDCTHIASHFGGTSDAGRQQNENGFMNLMGSYALEYVLNTNNASSTTWRNKITCLMDEWPAMVADQPALDNYNDSVPMNGAFINMVIAYDQIYNDLSAVQISSYNAMMDSWTAFNRTIPSSWELSNYGSMSVWSIFRDTDSAQIALDTACYHVSYLGNETIYPPAVCGSRQAYHSLSSEVSLAQLNRDGVSGSGPTYAWARLGGEAREKLGKWASKDIITYTGADTTFTETPSYSSRPLLAQFYDWLFTFTITPWNTKTVFADTANNQSSGADNFQGLAALYGHPVYLLSNAWLSAGKYSPYAGRIAQAAAKRISDPVIYPSEFIDYVFITSSVTASSLPISSLVIRNGGAAFWDEDTSSQTLMGVLDNAHLTRGDHWHLYDFNGMFLAGYGVQMLSNPGNGASTSFGVGGLSRLQTACDARYGNVLLMGNTNYANAPYNTPRGASGFACNSFTEWNPFLTGTQEHQYIGNGSNTPLYGGDGILESLVSTKFDYAVGLATGPYVYFDTSTGVTTQYLGQNQRNFLFVHADTMTSVNGYWAVEDEVMSASYTTVNQIWHPYGVTITTRTASQEYSWDIFPQLQRSTQTLTVFLASPPSSILFSTSAFADSTPQSVSGSNGNYLQANYLNGSYSVHASSAHILTVLYPSDQSGHNKSTFTRVADGEAEGATVLSGDTTDYFMASNGSMTVTLGGATFVGHLAFMRKHSGTSQFFVRKGTSFNDGSSPRYGFSSNAPVSVHLNGINGTITSTAATTTTFYYSSLGAIYVDGSLASGSAGANSFTVSLSSGNHALTLVSQATDPLDISYRPTVDQTASHYATVFGTITVTDSLYKVFRSSQTDATMPHWYVGYQMKNEFQSIQVHIKPTTNMPSVNVSMSNLVSTQPVAYTIAASTPDVTFYKEYYLNVSTPSCLSTSTFVGGARDYMPDPLIPKVDPYWQQTTDAFPLAILSTQTQTVWIDVHIPTAAPSGYYSGNIYVSSGGIAVSTLPVVIGVWNWLMPSTATLVTQGAAVNLQGMRNISYGGSDVAVQTYPNTRGSANNANTQTSVDAATQFLDNRWSTYGMDNYFAGDIPSTGWTNFMTDYAPLLNGTPTHASSAHPISTILPGAQMTAFRVNILDQGNSSSPNSFTAATYNQWVSTFTNQGWINKLAYKLSDEPTASIWGKVVSSGTLTRTFSTPIVPNVITTDLASSLLYSSGPYIVDWWMPLVSVLDAPTGDTRANYDRYLALSSGTITRHMGTYEDCVQGGTCGNGTVGPATNRPYPNRMIDGTPVANRALENFIFIDSMTLELYFDLNFCEVHQSAGGGEGCTTQSPWFSVYAFGNQGDGTLIYASTGMVVAVSTPIWCPSMRLKYYRDGEQDFEYETYLASSGYNAYARSQVNSWMLSSHNFSNDPAGIRAARLAMGNQIHSLSASFVPAITSALSASGTVGSAFSYQITATNTPTSFDAPGLPTGLSVDTGTGLISGVPVAVQVATTTLSATNASGTGTQGLTITIDAAPPPPPPPPTPSSGGASEFLQGHIAIQGKVRF